jgi:O-antigen ligase
MVLASDTLGLAAYVLPLAIAGSAGAAIVIHRAALNHRWALIAVLAFVMIVPSLSFRQREIGDIGLDWQNGIKFITWVVLFLGSAVNWRRYVDLFKEPVLGLLLCFTGIALLSTLYSEVPLYTAICAFGFVTYLLFACHIGATLDSTTILRAFTWCIGIHLVLTWTVALVIPDQGWIAPYGENQTYRLQGLSSHPNMLAKEASSFLCVLFVILGRRTSRPAVTWSLIALEGVTLLATGSRSSLGGVLIAVAAVHLFSSRYRLPMLLSSAAILALIVLLAATGILPDLSPILDNFSRTGESTEVLTLTGRTDLWALIWDLIQKRPLLGYGFNSTESVLSGIWWGPPSDGYGAHNTLLQSLFTLGIVGTIPFMTLQGIMLFRGMTPPRTVSRYIAWYLPIVGITEVEIASLPVQLTLVMFLTVVIDAAERRRALHSM